jgi:hypothetical protein
MYKNLKKGYRIPKDPVRFFRYNVGRENRWGQAE